jgi:hypothetical protein
MQDIGARRALECAKEFVPTGLREAAKFGKWLD